MRKKADKGEGDFSVSGRPHFTQHVDQEDSVTTLACKLCIQYIAQGINAGIRRPTCSPTRTTTVCSVCCCSTLPSLNYPRQLALMAAMTNSYLVLRACPVGRKATPWYRHHQQSALVINFADVHTGGGRWRGIWPDVDKSRQGGGSIFAIFLRTSFMDDPILYYNCCSHTTAVQ